MLNLTLKPGDYVDIGDDMRVIYTGGMPGNIHLLVDVPKDRRISRSMPEKRYKRNISDESSREIKRILWRDSHNDEA